MSSKLKNVFTAGVIISQLWCSFAHGQSPSKVNYDEERVPTFELPDPFVCLDGEAVADARTWVEKRRPEILGLFKKEVYGKSPGPPESISFEVVSSDDNAREGRAIRKEILIHLSNNGKQHDLNLLLYLPKNTKKPTPVFLGLNFYGNHAITNEPDVRLSSSWMRDRKEFGVENHRATEASRGARASRWPIDDILSHGYALATMHYGDIDPDFDDGFQNGIHPLFYEKNQTEPAADEWGSIGAWAWGLSRALDYLETDDDVDQQRVAVVGHSRLGKAALWAAASDERFAMAVSNESGCGGAALSRREFGETVERINKRFPHWFCDNFEKYNQDVNSMPVDQHLLIALIAPRPVYVASAAGDKWADPRGEFLAAKAADPVYRLLGTSGLPASTMPEVEHPVAGQIGYHIRSGKHDLARYDWLQFLDFADKHF